MVAQNRGGGGGRSGAEFFKGGETASEGVAFVGDERREDAGGVMVAQRRDGVVELRYGEVVALKIDAAEAVDLKIEETDGRMREGGRRGGRERERVRGSAGPCR